MIRLITAVLVLCVVSSAHAGHVVRQQVVYPYVYPQVNYFVGQPIRVEAMVQKALKDDPEYAEFQKFKQWKSLTEAATKPADPAAPPAMASVLSAKCASCHGGATPKKGLLLDGSAPLNAEQVLKAMRRVQAGTMPPKDSKITLTPEDAGEIFNDLLDLSKPPAPPAPAQPPEVSP